jgi:hypothetical protein
MRQVARWATWAVPNGAIRARAVGGRHDAAGHTPAAERFLPVNPELETRLPARPPLLPDGIEESGRWQCRGALVH